MNKTKIRKGINVKKIIQQSINYYIGNLNR